MTFCQQGNQRQEDTAVFFLWSCHAGLSEDAEMYGSYSGLCIYVLFPDAEESTGLNDKQAASALPPIKKLIVCPSRKGNDPPGLHISQTNSCSNLTAFDFVCMHSGQPRSVSSCSRLIQFQFFHSTPLFISR